MIAIAASSPGMIETRIAIRDAEHRHQAEGEGEGEQWSGDRAEVVHCALEPVSAPVDSLGHHIGQQGVAGGHPQAPSGPGRAPQNTGLRDRRRRPDQRGQDRGGRVATDRHRAPPLRIISQGAPDESAHTCQPSEIPSINPSAAAGAPSVAVTKLAISAAGPRGRHQPKSWPSRSHRHLVSATADEQHS